MLSNVSVDWTITSSHRGHTTLTPLCVGESPKSQRVTPKSTSFRY
jgi:hypothetical protein